MKALLIVDMQNDFMPQGSLPTQGADELIDIINGLMEKFPICFATKDWHPQDHISFAANHPDRKVGDVIHIGPMQQILWPVHCVQNSHGADFAPGLNTERIEKVFYKGVDRMVDSYSTFYDNARLRKTGLSDHLHTIGIKEIFFVGVATDYCVLYSVLDALELGFDVSVIADGCRAINLQPNDGEEAFEMMAENGATILTSDQVKF